VKKADLKQLIKPLVKECIHEVLLEEGLLSNIVSEVAVGLQGNLISESAPPVSKPDSSSEPTAKIRESQERKRAQRSKLMAAIGADAYNGVNLFEGTEAAPAQSTPKAGGVDLGSPGDAGVDISSLVGGASRMWDAMK
jgi:hypothetical protein